MQTAKSLKVLLTAKMLGFTRPSDKINKNNHEYLKDNLRHVDQHSFSFPNFSLDVRETVLSVCSSENIQLFLQYDNTGFRF